MKKFLSILLCVVLLLTVLPSGVFSVGAATSGYYTYYVYGGKAEITDVNPSISGNITIPSTLGGYPVTSIGNDAFNYCTSLKSITIPNSVTSITYWAFYYCSSLTSITVVENNENYSSVDGVLFNKDKTQLIYCPEGKSGAYTIPEGVTSIGDCAFQYCSSLTSITIPDSVTSIGESAFSGCESLTSIIIPDSVTSIGDHAFYSCDSLTSITIPDSVTTIGYFAFSNCKSLTSIIIPDSVTSIGDCAFYGCDSLTSITIPDSVTSIGDWAFQLCKSLTSITIPNSVTSIGDCAFQYCSSLTSITIPDSVTSIGNGAFKYCTSLKSITIPNSVTSIGDEAFYYCKSLTDVYYNGTEEQAKNITIGTNNDFLHNATWHYEEVVEDPWYLTYAVENGEAIITDCDTSIRGNITIPSTLGGYPVTTIGYEAFYKCTSLTSITIPNSVTTIGDFAFDDCTSLTSVTIPDSVTTIGNYAFYGCTSLTSITVSENNNYYSSQDGVLFNKDKTTIIFYPAGKSGNYTIPDSVTTIGDYAFKWCVSLTSVTIPDSVTTIGGRAFYECLSLKSVTIPNSVTTIGYYAFSYCKSLTDVYYNGTKEEAQKISIDSNNESLTNATWHYIESIEIAIEKSPNKTIYYLGEKLDTNGLKVVLKFPNETSKDITDEVDFSGYDSSTTGIKTITVTYNNFTATFKIVVTTPSINITSGSRIDMVEDSKQTINVSVLPSNQELIWTSFDESVATVENGVVKAVSEGTTVIVVEFTYNGVVYSSTCVVNVFEREHGDINGDLTVDQTDYQYIADIYTGKVKVENKAELCDLNGDGKFDIRDIIAINEIINA